MLERSIVFALPVSLNQKNRQRCDKSNKGNRIQISHECLCSQPACQSQFFPQPSLHQWMHKCIYIYIYISASHLRNTSYIGPASSHALCHGLQWSSHNARLRSTQEGDLSGEGSNPAAKSPKPAVSESTPGVQHTKACKIVQSPKFGTRGARWWALSKLSIVGGKPQDVELQNGGRTQTHAIWILSTQRLGPIHEK